MNARYYDPETGRFINEDSYRGDGEAFWHLYVYCGGDPVNATDPTGHKNVDVTNDLLKYFKLALSDGAKVHSYFNKSLESAIKGFSLFISLVKTRAKYDLKNQKWYIKKYKTNTIKFGALTLRFDDPGNIVFGFLTGASGIKLYHALLGAGLYQTLYGSSTLLWQFSSYGDDPRDSRMITLGYNCYLSYLKSKWRNI